MREIGLAWTRCAPGRLHDRRVDKRGGPEAHPGQPHPKARPARHHHVSARDGFGSGEVFKADGVASPATGERRRQPGAGI